jgi:hypothetical protein
MEDTWVPRENHCSVKSHWQNLSQTVVEHPEYGEVIQLQGDQRTHIRDFLKIVGIAREDQLKVKLNGHLFADFSILRMFYYSSIARKFLQ